MADILNWFLKTKTIHNYINCKLIQIKEFFKYEYILILVNDNNEFYGKIYYNSVSLLEYNSNIKNEFNENISRTVSLNKIIKQSTKNSFDENITKDFIYEPDKFLNYHKKLKYNLGIPYNFIKDNIVTLIPINNKYNDIINVFMRKIFQSKKIFKKYNSMSFYIDGNYYRIIWNNGKFYYKKKIKEESFGNIKKILVGLYDCDYMDYVSIINLIDIDICDHFNNFEFNRIKKNKIYKNKHLMLSKYVYDRNLFHRNNFMMYISKKIEGTEQISNIILLLNQAIMEWNKNKNAKLNFEYFIIENIIMMMMV